MSESLLIGRWFLADGAGLEPSELHDFVYESTTPPTTWGKAYKCLSHDGKYISFEADNGRVGFVKIFTIVLLPENCGPICRLCGVILDDGIAQECRNPECSLYRLDQIGRTLDERCPPDYP